jgi:hypothetical protein
MLCLLSPIVNIIYDPSLILSVSGQCILRRYQIPGFLKTLGAFPVFDAVPNT